MEIAELYEMAQELQRRDEYVCRLMGERLDVLAGRLDAMVAPGRESDFTAKVSFPDRSADRKPTPGTGQQTPAGQNPRVVCPRASQPPETTS